MLKKAISYQTDNPDGFPVIVVADAQEMNQAKKLFKHYGGESSQVVWIIPFEGSRFYNEDYTGESVFIDHSVVERFKFTQEHIKLLEKGA